MRHRLFTRVVTLVLAAFVALPAAAHGLGSDAGAKRTGGGPVACSSARIDVNAETLRVAQSATLCLLNRERADRGLRPLRLHAKLSRVAAAHSRDMVRRSYFKHDAPGGHSPFERMLAARYVPRDARWVLGENIGWGTTTLAQPAALVRAWMHSPTHRRNVLDGRFREIGIGIVLGVPVRDGDLRDRPGATYTTDFGAYS